MYFIIYNILLPLALSSFAKASLQLKWPSAISTQSPAFPGLIDATLTDLSRGMQDRLFNSVDLTKAYITRIEEVNADLNVVTEVNPDALEIAAALDDERDHGHIRGPLHGVPILIKDNIGTKDKMNNTAGSILLRGAQVPRDATAVAKLRDAGAIILGKTNMGEWAEGRSSNATSGWSSHGGQTYAAYCQKQSPGGSSSGSGVAVDLGLSFAALGTETAGSIIFPSHKNGIVGIKPTVGLTSRHMVVPLNEYQDTVGPMARTVQDAAVMLQIIAGHDTRDNYTSAIPEIPDYLAACKKGALRGARIGVPWNVLVDNQRPLDEEMDMFKLALKDMENEGATIVDANFTSGLDVFNADALRVAILASINTGLSRYLAELTHNPNGIKTLEDISQQTKQHPMTRYPRHNTLIFDIASEQGINTTHSSFWPARQEVLRLAGEEGLFGALDRFNLDAVVLPSAVSSSFPAYLGSPVISVPMGHYHESTPESWDLSGELVLYGPNVPVGLSFLGRKWDESKLIGLAYSYEQKTKVRDSKVPRVIQPKSEVHISRQFLAQPE